LKVVGLDDTYKVLADFGEERFAHRIARAIVEARSRAPITTTGALAKLVEAAVPKNRRDAAQHPATRTFQAVRIQVNHELDELKTALENAGALLAPGGRLAVISFHSLEDRIVKRFFEKRLHPDRDLDPRLPMPAGFNAQPWFSDVIRILPTKSEAESNPRARSSVLRVGTRTARLWED
ncbi:16S rRNA (cytosine(1402)-N(4))-methyltransferase RsmH, partial [Sutterella wadsworthensis]|uniref:16S rRNA (cytosine(1402)-N(4))-methyltransferase RsmH n=1 Tax=Sutterella wadsworthensis TaxID=40545 RepID=UPI0039678E02